MRTTFVAGTPTMLPCPANDLRRRPPPPVEVERQRFPDGERYLRLLTEVEESRTWWWWAAPSPTRDTLEL